MFPHYAGGTFWKRPARKLYAIPEGDLHQARSVSKNKKRKFAGTTITLDDDTDDDFDLREPAVEKSKCCCNRELQEIHQKLDSVLSLTPESKVPLGLKMMLQAFMCFICREFPIKPPVIFSKCCRSIIGCEHCINRWYSGEDVTTKMCPKCRAE